MKASDPPTEQSLGANASRDNFHRVVINAIPDPILVVDRDVCVLDCNTAANEVIGSTPGLGLGRRGGDLLHCIHAHQAPNGCGTAPACKGCTIRNSVALALEGQQPRRARHTLESFTGEGITTIHLLITTAPIDYRGSRLVLLILEDISELVELRRILPICAHCHKVRDDAAYWQDVESYCRHKLDIQFSHGICHECLKRYYPDIAT